MGTRLRPTALGGTGPAGPGVPQRLRVNRWTSRLQHNTLQRAQLQRSLKLLTNLFMLQPSAATFATARNLVLQIGPHCCITTPPLQPCRTIVRSDTEH